VIFISDMAPPPTDPADYSKFRSVEPINTDPDAPPPTTWEKLRRNFDMFVEVSKNRPIGETVCLKEAFILGKEQLKIHFINELIFSFKEYPVHFFVVWRHFY
jgi:hypothetical protein